MRRARHERRAKPARLRLVPVLVLRPDMLDLLRLRVHAFHEGGIARSEFEPSRRLPRPPVADCGFEGREALREGVRCARGLAARELVNCDRERIELPPVPCRHHLLACEGGDEHRGDIWHRHRMGRTR